VRVNELPRRLLALVALLALCAYGAALAGDFVFDDIHSVSANPALQDLSNLGRFWTDPDTFSGTDARMYRPALLTSFALNMWVSPTAASLKAGNVLLHAAVASLLFVWLWQLARRARAAFVAAALFAVHPLASEAINLVSARSELLSVFGMLVALVAHVAWQRRRANVWPLALAVLGCVLACGSKETGVVLPGLLLVQTFCLRHRAPTFGEWRRAAAVVLPLVALVVVYLLARKAFLGEATVQLLDRKAADPLHGHGRTLTTQLATMGTLLPRALWQCIAPVSLSCDPVVEFRSTFSDWRVLLGWAFVLGLTVAALWRGPGARLRRIGASLAWAIALPWVVIPLNMPLAEHRMYGPLLGVLVACVPLLARARRLAQRAPVNGNALRVAFALLLTFGCVLSAKRSLLYTDERELWRHELVDNPTSFRAWWGIGTTCRRMGDVPGSIAPLQRAHELVPDHVDVLRNYVESLIMLPDDQALPERALRIADRLQQRRPNDPWARTLVAQANLQAGRLLGDPGYFEVAERAALSCLEIAAPKGYVYQLASYARHGLGDGDGALQHLDDSIARDLATIGVRIDRVRLLRELGRTDEAQRDLMRLQRDFPTDGRVLGLLQHLAAPSK